MLRSAAKNHDRVTVVCDPADYDVVLAELAAGDSTTLATRRRLAAKVFRADRGLRRRDRRLPQLDRARVGARDRARASRLPRAPRPAVRARLRAALRGEPHQSGAFYRDRNAKPGSLALADSLGAGGKELSFNNLVDVDAALEAVREHEAPTAVVVKHTNPCGVAAGASLEQAYRSARAADEVSAFGGIVALNRPVDAATAKALVETFLECVVAPRFEDDALEFLRTKKNLRLLATGAWLAADEEEPTFKRVGGGLVVQGRDKTGGAEVKNGRVVTKRAPTPEELAGLDFTWRVCKHVKSNAIVLGGETQTFGVGAGQMSRVESGSHRLQQSGGQDQGRGARLRRVLPVPRRGRARALPRRHRHRPARRQREGRGGHRSGRQGRRRDGLHRGEALPSLGGRAAGGALTN
jgi:phosphoribosylaminoimidazolecarboxamide formyltransferase/IMP cyclohydrolase